MKVTRIVLALAALASTAALAAGGTGKDGGTRAATAKHSAATAGGPATWLDQWLAVEVKRPARNQQFDSAG